MHQGQRAVLRAVTKRRTYRCAIFRAVIDSKQSQQNKAEHLCNLLLACGAAARVRAIPFKSNVRFLQGEAMGGG